MLPLSVYPIGRRWRTVAPACRRPAAQSGGAPHGPTLDAPAAEPGQRILVNGASGGVGTFAIQLAKTQGLHVTAVCSTRNLQQAKDLGADDTIDYTVHDFTRDGRRYDIIIDLVGNRRVRDLGRALAPDGTLVMSGGGVPGTGLIIGPLGLLIRAQLWSRFTRTRLVAPLGGG